MAKRKSGFTLIELMVVLLIMGMLFSVAAPSLSSYSQVAAFNKNNNYAQTMLFAAVSSASAANSIVCA